MGRAEGGLRIGRREVAPVRVDRHKRTVLDFDRQLVVVVLGPFLGLVELAEEDFHPLGFAILGEVPELLGGTRRVGQPCDSRPDPN